MNAKVPDKAGYAPKTAAQAVCRMLKDVNAKAYLEELRSKSQEGAVKTKASGLS